MTDEHEGICSDLFYFMKKLVNKLELMHGITAVKFTFANLAKIQRLCMAFHLCQNKVQQTITNAKKK